MPATTSKVISNTIIYFVSGIIPPLAGFFLLPLYTRFLAPEDYGILALTILFSGLVSVIFTFQLNVAIMRLYVDYEDEVERKILLGSICSFSYLVSVLLFFALWLLGERLFDIIFKMDIPFYPYWFLTIIATVFGMPQRHFKALLRIQERAKSFAILNLLSFFFTVSFNIVFVVFFRERVVGIIKANCIVNTSMFFFYWFSVRRDITVAFSISEIIKALRFSLPLVPHTIANYIYSWSDRFILERFVSLGNIGIYSLAEKFTTISRTVVTSFSGSYAPHFFKKCAKGDDLSENQQVMTYWFVGMVPFTLFLCLFLEDVIIIALPISYHPAAPIAPILIFGYIFRGFANFPWGAVYVAKKTWWISFTSIIAGLSNIVLNLYFVPRYGIRGAAWATTFSFFILCLLSFVGSQIYFPLKYHWSKIIRAAIAGVFVYVGFHLMNVSSTRIYIILEKVIWMLVFIGMLFLLRIVSLHHIRQLFFMGKNAWKRKYTSNVKEG